MTWVEIDIDRPNPGELSLVEVGGLELMIVNIQGEVQGVQNTCTHMGASLSRGELRDSEIRCPRHGAVFDLETGKALSRPAPENLETYDVRVNNGVLEIDIY